MHQKVLGGQLTSLQDYLVSTSKGHVDLGRFLTKKAKVTSVFMKDKVEEDLLNTGQSASTQAVGRLLCKSS